MNDENPPILELQNASIFRGAKKVFSDFSLRLDAGLNTVILGPNGSGKTTLLKILTRELSPVATEKSVCRLFGQERFTLWDLRKKLGIVSQDFQNDYRSLATGLEVVLSAFFGSVGIHGHNVVTPSMSAQAREILKRLDLSHLANCRYLELSTGEQRRLLLARALVHNPKVLIFDEPTSGLDLKASFTLMKDMRALSQAGVNLILVTHHIHEIIPEIQHVVCLKQRKVFAEGRKETLLTSATMSALYDVDVEIREHRGFYQVYPK